jgi:EAL domain-containing protein (putative c-di-GMP-specific phosphodiesterase class I)/PleD family two-component response regulator
MKSSSPPGVRLAVVADDDAGQRLLMEQALTQANFSVISVADGAAAVDRVFAQPPEIVFLDIMMPVKSGLQACREIRDAFGEHCPPIIVVTSRDADDAIAEGFDAGATDYLIKPVNWTLLGHRVRGWLAAHQARQAAARQPGHSERTLQVSRSARVLSDSDASASDASGRQSLPDAGPELASVLPPPFAEQIMLCVRKVLKTRDAAELRHAQWAALISAEGPDRARVAIREAGTSDGDAAELFRLAYRDAVTGLPNRYLFERTAAAAVTDAQLRGRSLMLLCVTFDPPAALRPDQTESQQAARALAEQLVTRLRSTNSLVRHDGLDAGDSPVASADGMHFLVLVNNAEAPGALQAVVGRIREACTTIAEQGFGHLSLTPRIGMAQFPQDADTVPALIERAMLAVGEARQQRDMEPRRAQAPEASAQYRADLAGELRHALSEGQIVLHYQPRIDLATRQVAGAEALLRWQHPLRGLLTADILIAMAESAGETARLTDWALEQACLQTSIWARELPFPPRVAVNTSELQLARPDFASNLIARVTALGLDPALLEIEIGEQFLDISEAVLAQLLELRHAGIGLIVDDFSAGRASLGTLRRLRIDGFKMDYAQLRAGSKTGDTSGIYALTTSIARARQACVIAKNIETAEELAIARSRGCDQAQGFHLCQPLPVAEFERYLARAGGAAAAGT